MIAGEIYAPRKVRLVHVDEPIWNPGDRREILFQPQLACLCGSDLPYYQGDYPEFAPQVGQSLHEMIGLVVKSSSPRFEPGQRALCVPVHHFGFFERYVIDAGNAIPLVSVPSDEEALMAQPLGTVLFAMRRLPNVIGWNIVVVGLGPMGQLFCAALRNLGARSIIGVEPIAERRATALQMGAHHALNPADDDVREIVLRETGGRLADLVIEVVGHREQVMNYCVGLCKIQGHLLSFGVPCKTIDGFHWSDFFWKNITVHTSVGPDFGIDFPLAMQWINEGRVDVRPVITHRFPVDRIQEAFDLFDSRRHGVLKVLIDFPGAQAAGGDGFPEAIS